MRVTVDEDLCCAYGNCVLICPEVFDLPDGAGTVRIASPEVGGQYRTSAQEAVRDCPTGALEITP